MSEPKSLVSKLIYTVLPDGRLKTCVIARKDCPYCGVRLEPSGHVRKCGRCGFRVAQMTVIQ